jgi:hypothetical protein
MLLPTRPGTWWPGSRAGVLELIRLSKLLDGRANFIAVCFDSGRCLTCGALTNAKSARRATSSSPSPSVRQGWGAGTATARAAAFRKGVHTSSGGRSVGRGARKRQKAKGAAQQRRCPVVFISRPCHTSPPHTLGFLHFANADCLVEISELVQIG